MSAACGIINMCAVKNVTNFSGLKGLKAPYILRVNASAGSGKTNLLAGWFIRLFLSEDVSLKSILAITFTNAATAEMKQRVLQTLKELAFSSGNPDDRLKNILGILDERAGDKQYVIKKIDELIQNYSDFNIKTIDSFINSLINVSSLELGISPSSEIFANVDYYLNIALEDFFYLYEEEGYNEITEAIDRYLELTFNADASTSWFVADKIKKLFNKIRQEEQTSPGTFGRFASVDFDGKIKEFASAKKELLSKIEERGAGEYFKSHFIEFLSRKRPVHEILKLTQWPLANSCQWLKKNNFFNFLNLDNKLKSAYLELLDAFIAKEAECYPKIYEQIRAPLDELKKKRNFIFIDELNKKIYSLFGNDATCIPWCFFLIGDKISHFLIDEFQDTSQIQFLNLKPLIENALAGSEKGGGSFFLVGDIKQAIYRFKGGSSKLFTGIFENFKQSARNIDYILKNNFRSKENIVEFASKYFSPVNLKEKLKELECKENENKILAGLTERLDESFQHAGQTVPDIPDTKGGYVYLEAFKDDESKPEEAVNELLDQRLKDLFLEFSGRIQPGIKDIGVLVRKGSEVERITSFLLSIPDLPFPVISEKSMDIRENPLLAEVISFLKFLNFPPDDLSFFIAVSGKIFTRLAGRKKEDFLQWKTALADDAPLYIRFRKDFPDLWELYLEPFFKKVGFLPPYDLTRELFSLWHVFENFSSCSGFFYCFLQLLSEMEEKGQSSLDSFLRFIQTQDDDAFQLKLETSEKGIKVMTLHKSKGLSFDIVVLPDLYLSIKNNSRTEFFNLAGIYKPGENEGIREMVRLKGSFVEKISKCPLGGRIEKAVDVYYKEQVESFIDELNLIYVGFTRAKEEVYGFFSRKKKNILPLLFGISDADILQIGRGEEKIPPAEINQKESFFHQDTPGASGRTHWYNKLVRQKLPSAVFKDALTVKKGSLVHEALALIKKLKGSDYKDKIKEIVDVILIKHGDFFEKEDFFEIILHTVENAKDFFFLDDSWQVYTELEFMTGQGIRFVADRLLKSNKELVVIDFKLADRSHEHLSQVKKYTEHLKGVFNIKQARGYVYNLKDFKAELVNSAIEAVGK